MIKGTPTALTADAAVGTSGKPVIVYHITLTSGGTASTLALHNGTSTSGTKLESFVGTINTTVRFNFPSGLYFPAGCFADVDANIAAPSTIWWHKVAA